MANRRMFNKEIVNSDAFTSMPISSQALYFHLGMEADDDGFVNNPLRVARTINVGGDDLKVLILKKFLIDFQTGIVVIKHWRKNNQIRYDRYNQTNYLEEASKLFIKKDGTYTVDADNIGVIPFMATKKQPDSNHWLPQYSVVKSSLVEISEVKESKESNNNDLYFMDQLNKDVKKNTAFETLEKLIKNNFLTPKRELTEVEARMLFEWVGKYPKSYLEHIISELCLVSTDKRNFRYLKGAIEKAYDTWSDKPVETPQVKDEPKDVELDDVFAELKALKEKGNK
jgi:hypothetical protein